MPTYQYACTGCGYELEAVQSFSDDPLTTCTECGGALRKLFGNVGVVFKGSGFYRTDSRKSETSSGSSTKADTAGSSTSSDTKPASTSKSASTGTSTSSGSSSGASTPA